MGMQVQSHWTCDRCDTIEFEDLGKVPEGWVCLGLMEIISDAEDGGVDFKLPKNDQRNVLCRSCVLSYKLWFGKDAEAPPVVSAEPGARDESDQDEEEPVAPPVEQNDRSELVIDISDDLLKDGK